MVERDISYCAVADERVEERSRRGGGAVDEDAHAALDVCQSLLGGDRLGLPIGHRYHDCKIVVAA
jgi:hypothetical protein